MENTSVLTVGVTSDRALGSTFNTLRAQFERLRMPLEGMQVEPYISEISRLGLEVDKTAQAQRRLASDQTWALKAQVDQVRRLTDEIERLRKLCLSASEIGSSQAPRQSVVMRPVQGPMGSDPPEPRSSEQGFIPLESANSGLTVVKAGMIGTATVGAGVAAAALGRAAHRMYKRQSLKRRREITRGVRQSAGKAGAKLVSKLGLATLEDSGQDQAEAVGAALGGALGNMGAQLLGGLTKNKQIQMHGGEIGELIGEGVGGFIGKTFHGWFSDTAGANEVPDDSAVQASPALSQQPAEQGAFSQGPQTSSREGINRGLVIGGALVGTAAVAMAGRKAHKAYSRLPRKRRNRLAGGLRESAGKAGAKLIGNLGLALLEDSGEDQAEAVGSALGGAMGNLGTQLLGGLTKNKRIQQYGGEIGELIGEGIGGFLGKTVHGVFSGTPAANDPSAITAPGSAISRSASGHTHQVVDEWASDESGEQVEEEEEEEEVDEAAPEPAFSEAQEPASAALVQRAAQKPAFTLGSTAVTGLAGKARPGSAGASLARRAFRRVPGVALLDTGLQLAETFNSDATQEQKLEGYGSAVGGLGGGLAGAAAGAAIGSVVPVIGTAIGGLIGGVLGSMGGEGIGGWLGRTLASNKDEAAGKPAVSEAARVLDTASAPPTLPASPAASPTQPTPPTTINQQFTFTSNMPVTFNNSLDDPSVLQQLEMIARRQLEELMRQARSAQLADTPHIAL
ncbi:Uncharacterised protein [Pseudomonas putida]|nr:Uncharacterised protein [Pseudomonas putida]